MSFLTLFVTAELIHRFYFTVATIVKTYGWENDRSGNCRRGDVPSGKSLSGKYPVGKVSIGELSFGEVSVGELSGYQFISETFSEELL